MVQCQLCGYTISCGWISNEFFEISCRKPDICRLHVYWEYY